ncbi:MAG: hypothetical protein H6828_03770 [Planctomycetes bacterium]|nr:hypothetical protein [Planctomycetota bacterium]
MAEWKIRRRHGECSTCQRAFEDGERHASSLRFDEEQALVREDLCRACWRAGDEANYVFWWFTHHTANRRTTVQLDLGSLERLFLELAGREEETLRELRYLLCLLLMRKRRLKLVRVQRGSKGERLVVRRPRRQEDLEVWVFDFTPERMEELRTRLQEVLDGVGGDEEGEGASGADGPGSGEDVEARAEDGPAPADEGALEHEVEDRVDDEAPAEELSAREG